jgi:hypothetical protein
MSSLHYLCNLEHYLYNSELLVDIETIKKLKFPLDDNHETVEHLRLTTMMSAAESKEYLMTIYDLCMRLSGAAVRGRTAGETLKKVLEELEQ